MYRYYSAESPSSTMKWDTFTPVQCLRPFVTTARWAHSLLFNTQSSSSPSHACRCTFLRVPGWHLSVATEKKPGVLRGSAMYVVQQKTPLWQTQNCPGCLSDSRSMEGTQMYSLHKAIIFLNHKLHINSTPHFSFTDLYLKAKSYWPTQGFPGGTGVKNPPANAGASKTRFNPWVGKIPWRRPRTEEPGGLQFIGSQRVRHNWHNLARTTLFNNLSHSQMY